MSQSDSRVKPVTVFYSYSHRDESLREQLETHLSLLKRTGLISGWHDRIITAGADWREQIDKHQELAQIILLLVSPDFLASDYCYDIEMARALERHEKKETHVIPVILRPCVWQDAPFAYLQPLPKDAKPVTSWLNQDEAWLDVARGVRQACQEIRQVQATGIRIYCEQPDGPLAWPRCAVRLPGAPEASWDLRFGADTYELSWGKSTTIELRPQIEYDVMVYVGIPMSVNVGLVRIKCTLEENEVIQYVYRVLKRPGTDFSEIYGEARLVQVENS